MRQVEHSVGGDFDDAPMLFGNPHIAAPAVIGLRSKSRYSEVDRADAIIEACKGAAGVDYPIPVFYGGRREGWTLSNPRGSKIRYWDDPANLDRHHKEKDKYDKIWCGFNSYDDMISKVTNATAGAGRLELQWGKSSTTAPVAANWYDLWAVGGSPTAGAYGGASRTAVRFDDTSTGSLAHGGNVSTLTKHMTSAWGSFSAGTSPVTLVLYDRVLDYEAGVYTTNNLSMTNTLTALRYTTNSDSGLKIIFTAQTVHNSTVSQISVLHYTDQGGNAAQAMPTSPTVNIIVSGAAPTATLGARIIAPATTATTVVWGAPYLPFAAGDTGCQKIEDITHTGTNTGTWAAVLGRPLATLPMTTALVPSMIDLVNMVFGLERVFDGACLSMLAYFAVATGATLQGGWSVAWG